MEYKWTVLCKYKGNNQVVSDLKNHKMKHMGIHKTCFQFNVSILVWLAYLSITIRGVVFSLVPALGPKRDNSPSFCLVNI